MSFTFVKSGSRPTTALARKGYQVFRLFSVALALVIMSGTLHATSGATTAQAATASTVTAAESSRKGRAVVRVGSFNIKNVVFDRNAKRAWPKRRSVIVRQVLRNDVGLLGVQEAQNTPIGVFRDGWNQYLDLRAALNRAGGHYRLTSRAAVNCENPRTPYRCRFRDRGASRSTRIMYDARKFEKVRSGSIRYKRQVGSEDRYLVWGVFKTRNTGQRLLFTTTHITSGATKVKVSQWRQMIREIGRLSRNGRLPVIATGDMNASKYNSITKKLLPAIKAAGFPDILNQRYREARIDNARARRVVRAWISTLNRGQSNVANFAQEHNRSLGAGHLDYIFASRRLPVLTWKQVVNFHRKKLRMRNPTPSDHNLITATLVLPRR